MLVLLTACALLAISAGVENSVKCGGGDGTNRIVRVDNGSGLMAMYQLEKKKLFFRPVHNTSSTVLWELRYANRTGTSLKKARTQIRAHYQKLVVTFTNETDMIQVRWRTKGQLKYTSKWVTLYLGKSPVLRLFNNTESKLEISADESLNVCFTLSGAPRPRISLFHSSLDRIRSEVNNTRYKVKENCLEFGPVRPQDTGTLTVQATNCFNISTVSFSLTVPGEPLTPNPTPKYDTKNLPYWTYALIAVGSVAFISLLLFLFYLKCCKKDKSDHSQLAAKKASKDQKLEPHLPEGLYDLPVIETKTDDKYPRNPYDCLSVSSLDIDQVVTGPTGYDHLARDTPERQSIEIEFCAGGYALVGEQQTGNEIHESAYSYATVDAPKRGPERQTDTQSLDVQNKKVLSDGMKDATPLRPRFESHDYGELEAEEDG